MINCAETNCVFEGQRVVIQLGKDVLENESKAEFFLFLNSLKKENGIIPVLLDSDGKLLKDDLSLSNPNHNESYLFKKYNELGDGVSNYIKKILFLKKDYQILDRKGYHIELISLLSLKKILSNDNENILIKPGTKIYNTLFHIQTLLENGFSKVSLTGINEVEEEIKGFGKGTMFVNLDDANFRKLENIDILIQIHDKQLEDGKWAKKTKKELEVIIDNGYDIYQINGTILGGYSLKDNYSVEIDGEKIEGKYLGNVFTTKNGGGVGKRMFNHIKSQNPIILCHTNARSFFEKIGFKKIEGHKTKSGADLYVYRNENLIK